MVKLYIENQFIELDNEVQFAITKTFENITNPTSIINDWSKTVSIPFTDNNNEVFGHIYNPDRLTLHTSNESLTTGLYFDPLKKLDFRLEWDSMLLMQGYAKMTSVTKSNGKGRYNVTLNGELGKVFQEMKKITFDRFKYKFYEDDFKYFIDTTDFYEEKLNASLVRDTEVEYTYEDKLQKKTNSDYKRNNVINFTLNNNFVEGFDYTSFCNEDGTITSFNDYYNDARYTSENKTFEQIWGISPDSFVGDGFTPTTTEEFRATTQIPYIYFNQLIRIFFDKVTQITGYDVNFDKEWFNKYNPYWTKYVMTLSSLFNNSANVVNSFPKGSYTNDNYKDAYFYLLRNYQFAVINNDLSNLPTLPITFQLNFKSKTPILNSKLLTTADESYILGEIITKIKEDSKYTVPIYGDIQQWRMINNPEYQDINWNYKIVSSNSIVVTFVMQGSYEFFRGIIEDKPNATWLYTMEVAASINGNPFLYNGVPLEYDSVEWTSEFSKTVTNGGILSNDNEVTIATFWDESVNIFEVILQYLKMFRIKFIIDDLNKTINLVSNKTYFDNYEILNWTDKLDISKDYTVTPITFSKKYLLFNVDESDTRLHKTYKDTVGYNFGEKRIITDYNFNTETEKLFNTQLKHAISFSPFAYSIFNLKPGYDIYDPIQGGLIQNTLNEFGNENGEVDKTFGYMGFYLFSYARGTYYVTDNIEGMQEKKCCCYKNPYELYLSSETPLGGYSYISDITMVDANTWYWSTYGTPEISFSNISNFTDNTTFDIYTTFWQKYLDERYNTNNKIVTCYLDITPIDYYNFDFNKFIKIDNQLYFVNKIYDYDITSNSTTKVDLITVQDITGYTDNNFVLNFFEVFFTPTEIYEPDWHYILLDENITSRTIYISSSSDVTWEITNIEEGTIKNFTINGVAGNNGIIKKGVLQPVTFSTFSDEARFTVTFTNEQGATFNVDVVSNVQTMPIYTEDNKLVEDWETLTLAGQETQSLTVYVTSNTDVDVKIHNHSGSLADVQINGADASELYHGYDTVTLEAGVKVPLTISIVYGGDDFNLEMYLNNGSADRVFYVDCVW